VTSLHTGSLAPKAALVQADNPAFHLTAVKTAEDSSGIIVRGYNQNDTPIAVAVTPGFATEGVSQVNLDESLLAEAILNSDGAISFDLAPHKLASLLLKKPEK
jgi:alpha-mannosidase